MSADSEPMIGPAELDEVFGQAGTYPPLPPKELAEVLDPDRPPAWGVRPWLREWLWGGRRLDEVR